MTPQRPAPRVPAVAPMGMVLPVAARPAWPGGAHSARRCNNAVPGVVVAAPGESLMPEPGSGDRRRSVTSSTPSNCSPRFAPPRGAVPKRMTTIRCNSIDSTTNWVSVGGAVRVEVAEWRAGGRCVITEGVGGERAAAAGSQPLG